MTHQKHKQMKKKKNVAQRQEPKNKTKIKQKADSPLPGAALLCTHRYAVYRSHLKPEVQKENGGGVLGRQPQGKAQLVPHLPRHREVRKDNAVFQVRQ